MREGGNKGGREGESEGVRYEQRLQNDEIQVNLPPSLPHSFAPSLLPSSWIKIPPSSLLVTGAVFIVFVLDMASPGYGSFALIPNWHLNITALTTDVRSDLENLMRSKRLTQSTQKQPAKNHSLSKDCRTLLDAYKKGALCQFEPPTYSDTSPQKSNTTKSKQ